MLIWKLNVRNLDIPRFRVQRSRFRVDEP